MTDNWIEIQDILRYCINNNVLESYYQREIENCFKILGWRKANDTLRSQVSIPIGSTSYIQPDIVLQHHASDGALVPVVAIEIKRPDNIKNERQEAQLFSYMRQMRLNFGLYIGEKIQVFYDIPTTQDKPVPVLTVSIDTNDPNGDILCQLFEYEHFSLSNLEQFCKDQIDREDEIRRLSEHLSAITRDPDTSLKAMLRSALTSDGFRENIVAELLNNYTLSIHSIQDAPRIPSPAPQTPPQSSHTDSAGRDLTKFSFDGGKTFYNKRRFVLAVIRDYISTHPGITFKALERVFYPEIYNSSKGVIKRIEDVMEMIKESEDTRIRYFMDEVIILKDGTHIVVNNQWGTRFPYFLDAIKGIYQVISDSEYKHADYINIHTITSLGNYNISRRTIDNIGQNDEK